MIELAHRFGRILRGRDHVVQRARLMVGAAARIGILLVVEHLVFETDDVFLTFRRAVLAPVLHRRVHPVLEFLSGLFVVQHDALLYAVLHAAIAAGRNLPVELHFEIAITGLSEQVLVDIGVRQRFDAAILDGECIARRHLLRGVFPAGVGLAVEHQAPPGGLLLGGKLIVGGRGSQHGGAREGGDFQDMRHRFQSTMSRCRRRSVPHISVRFEGAYCSVVFNT